MLKPGATHGAKAEVPYRIQTDEERSEVEWLVKDRTYKSVEHYEEIMTRINAKLLKERQAKKARA